MSRRGASPFSQTCREPRSRALTARRTPSSENPWEGEFWKREGTLAGDDSQYSEPKAPAHHPGVQALDRLVGRRRISGGWEGTGTYDWMVDGFFTIQRGEPHGRERGRGRDPDDLVRGEGLTLVLQGQMER